MTDAELVVHKLALIETGAGLAGHSCGYSSPVSIVI